MTMCYTNSLTYLLTYLLTLSVCGCCRVRRARATVLERRQRLSSTWR